jgi:intracellular multiplication protein IcmE
MSPAMREAAASAAEAEFERQKASGQRVVVPQEPVNKIEARNAQGSGVQLAQSSQTMTAEQLALQRMQEAQQREMERQSQTSEQNRREGLERQLAGLISGRDIGPAITPVAFVQTKSGSTHGLQEEGGAARGAAGAASGAQPVLSCHRTQDCLADSLEIFVAEVASDVDTYRTNFCSVRVVAGRLSGAYLVGKCTQRDQGLSMEFTQMRLKGEAYQIDAIGMDEKTATDALSNIDVDRRLLQRVVFPITVAAVGGAASVLAQPPTTTSLDGGVVVQSTAAASKGQAIAAGVSAGVGVLSQMAAAEAAKPVQITMPAGAPIGVMFRKPVRTAL